MKGEFHETSINIFDWELYRIFRDNNKEIISIVLQKDGIFKEYHLVP